MTTNNKPISFWHIFGYLFFLNFIGLVFLSISSPFESINLTGVSFGIAKKQLIWSLIGLSIFFIIRYLDYSLIKKFSPILFYFSLFLLFLVVIPQFGLKILGANRWLNFGFFGVQPSELFKFTSILYFSNILTKNVNLKHFFIPLVIGLFLIIIEPNLSTTILIATISIFLFYLANGDIKSIFIIGVIALFLGIILTITSPYRLKRLQSLINPQSTQAYHSNQLIVSLASGHIFGKGFANSDQKYMFLPKVSTDSIAAVIGEETGFIGMLIICLAYLYLVSHLINFSNTLTDHSTQLFTIGISLWIAFQALINLGAITSIIPLTGMPLPFISYGGSSLVSLYLGLGVVANIHRQQQLLYLKNSDQQNHHHHRSSSHSSH
ncbi:MAG TPA: FtsW/RodA/SpoVE family cell cycle protein [Candidatus Woesebacteria bacterium]|nr:FtsW/RodA/SpoVE family cell cycle protein [Candidatus Woesebacteria bacterium]HPJ17054.1 FtsW/RodA/SpoVE family cell cycle protein [Candidatus Woesebacteria bacterium]